MWFRIARFFCRTFCRVFFKYNISGIENIPDEGGFLLISNHQSFLDPLYCGTYSGRPLFFLARDSLFRNKLFGALLRSINVIPVRRGEADIKAMKTVIGKLKDGHGVCLFPEATRSSDGKISAFKPGFGLLCRRGNAAVVPVVIDGGFEAWPRNKKIFTPGVEINVRFGECISVEEIKSLGDRALAEKLTQTLRQMQNEVRKAAGKEEFDYSTGD